MTEVFFVPLSCARELPLAYVVIAARCQDQWVFVRHKRRSTWEIPGGHIEAGETAEAAAMRELWEETGAVQVKLNPVCVYGVRREGEISYGMLFLANILQPGFLPEEFEIGEIMLTDAMPKNLTYPDIQPALWKRIQLLTAMLY